MTGAGKELNFPIVKTIKINERQDSRWNPKGIKAFLDGKNQQDIRFLENIIKKFARAFVELQIDINFENNELDVIEKLYKEIR